MVRGESKAIRVIMATTRHGHKLLSQPRETTFQSDQGGQGFTSICGISLDKNNLQLHPLTQASTAVFSQQTESDKYASVFVHTIIVYA